MSASGSDYIGSVVGYVSSGTNIKQCYWSSDVERSNACGYGSPTIDSETKQVSLNTTTMDSLNTRATSNSWSKWFMLYLNGGKINSLNQEALVVTQRHFPDPVRSGNTFLYWCNDDRCDGRYNNKTTDMSQVSGLYAGWSIVSVTFYGNGGTP